MTTAKDQARAQYENLAALVAAAECDFDRLHDLRDERQALRDELEDAAECVRYHHDAAPEDVTDECTEMAEWARCRDELVAWEIDNADDLAELEAAAGDYESQEDAEQAIQEDPLSVEVRSDWVQPGEELTPSAFRILLCTGGPAVQLVGELDEYNEPSRACLEYQDWGTPWTEYVGADQDVLLAYARRFYFAA